MYSQGIDCSMQRVFSASALIHNALKNKSRIRRRTGRIRTYVLALCVYWSTTPSSPRAAAETVPQTSSKQVLYLFVVGCDGLPREPVTRCAHA